MGGTVTSHKSNMQKSYNVGSTNRAIGVSFQPSAKTPAMKNMIAMNVSNSGP